MDKVSIDRYVKSPVVFPGKPTSFSVKVLDGILHILHFVNGWQGYSSVINNDEFREFREFISRRSFEIRTMESEMMTGIDCIGFLKMFSFYWNRVDLKPIINAVYEDPLLNSYFTYNELADIITATHDEDPKALEQLKSRNGSASTRLKIAEAQRQYEMKKSRFTSKQAGSGWYLSSDRPLHQPSSGIIEPIRLGEKAYNFSVIAIPEIIVATRSFYK